MRRKWLPDVALILVASILAAAAFIVAIVHGQESEAAMTACTTLPDTISQRARGVVTVESRFPPWTFTCVFHNRAGNVVARARSEYEPPWPRR